MGVTPDSALDDHWAGGGDTDAEPHPPAPLSTRIDGDELDMHAMMTELATDGTLDALEARIAAIERVLA